MCISAIEVLLATGTSLVFLQPSQIQADLARNLSVCQITQGNSESLVAQKRQTNSVAESLPDRPKFESKIVTNQPARFNSSLHPHNRYTTMDEVGSPTSFKAGVASWKTTTEFGSLGFNGNFDPNARFTKGKALWGTENSLGSFDLAINLSDRIEPTKTVTSWHKATTVGLLKFQGNFDPDAKFSDGNISWQAKTDYGSMAIEGKLDREMGFSGGKVKVATSSLIGSINADVQVDESTKFSGVNASWNTKLPFSASFAVSGKFDEKTVFKEGSVGLSKNFSLGVFGVKANVNQDNRFTSGSAFWQAKVGVGSINLNADIKKDGEFESKLNLKFPF